MNYKCLILMLFVLLLSMSMVSANEIVDNITSILALLPALIAVFLVFPFPNYHIMRVSIGELIGFYSNRQKYVWRGWCSSYEFKDK